MSQADNKALVRRFLDELINRQNLEAALELLAPDYVDHNAPASQAPGRAGVRATYEVLRKGFAEFQTEIEDMVAEGDRVAVRASARARHVGPFAGVAPSGAVVEWESVAIYRIQDGRIAERWGLADVASRVHQAQAANEGQL